MTAAQEDLSKFDPASLKKKPSDPRTLFGLIMTGVASLFMFMAVVPLFIILFYLLLQGITSLSPSVFTELPPPPWWREEALVMPSLGQ